MNYPELERRKALRKRLDALVKRSATSASRGGLPPSSIAFYVGNTHSSNTPRAAAFWPNCEVLTEKVAE